MRPFHEADLPTASRLCQTMGYGKLGPVIEDTVRSLVNGLLRQGRPEAEGSILRRVAAA